MTAKQLFNKIHKIAKSIKTEVYVVGGFVRDEILGRGVGKDIDFVVLGSGLEFAKNFDKELKGPSSAKAMAGKQGSLIEFPGFDTARYVMADLEIEFAGARCEKYDAKSRKPKVASATLAQDLSRRDFTVNAMARPVGRGGKLGKVVDPFGEIGRA